MPSFRWTLFFLLLAALCASYFARDNYRNIKEIHPAVLQQPVQEPEPSFPPITSVTRQGCRIEVTPVARYKISGLIVGRVNYGFVAESDCEKLYPLDLSMVWGGNAGRGVYREV